MNGVHDMGGMHGFGPVLPEENEPVFHERWESRVFAMMRLARAPNFRPGIESMQPDVYLRSSYFERWLHTVTEGLKFDGRIDENQLEARVQRFRNSPSLEPDRVENPHLLAQWRASRAGSHTKEHRPENDAAFQAGDVVRARNINPVGHTRLPRYIRGHLGTVRTMYGWHNVQDQDPPGVKIETIEPVYSVRFEGNELWGEQAEPNSAVYIDMWESYLESA